MSELDTSMTERGSDIDMNDNGTDVNIVETPLEAVSQDDEVVNDEDKEEVISEELAPEIEKHNFGQVDSELHPESTARQDWKFDDSEEANLSYEETSVIVDNEPLDGTYILDNPGEGNADKDKDQTNIDEGYDNDNKDEDDDEENDEEEEDEDGDEGKEGKEKEKTNDANKSVEVNDLSDSEFFNNDASIDKDDINAADMRDGDFEAKTVIDNHAVSSDNPLDSDAEQVEINNEKVTVLLTRDKKPQTKSTSLLSENGLQESHNQTNMKESANIELHKDTETKNNDFEVVELVDSDDELNNKKEKEEEEEEEENDHVFVDLDDNDEVFIYDQRNVDNSKESHRKQTNNNEEPLVVSSERLMDFPVLLKARDKTFLAFHFVDNGSDIQHFRNLPVLFENGDLINEKMETFFPFLRNAFIKADKPFAISHELVLEFLALNLSLSEDNIYCTEVSFADITALFSQLNHNTPENRRYDVLVIKLATRERFSSQFNGLLEDINHGKGFTDIRRSNGPIKVLRKRSSDNKSDIVVVNDESDNEELEEVLDLNNAEKTNADASLDAIDDDKESTGSKTSQQENLPVFSDDILAKKDGNVPSEAPSDDENMEVTAEPESVTEGDIAKTTTKLEQKENGEKTKENDELLKNTESTYNDSNTETEKGEGEEYKGVDENHDNDDFEVSEKPQLSPSQANIATDAGTDSNEIEISENEGAGDNIGEGDFSGEEKDNDSKIEAQEIGNQPQQDSQLLKHSRDEDNAEDGAGIAEKKLKV